MNLEMMVWLNTLVLLGTTVIESLVLYRVFHRPRPEPDREF